LEKSLNNNNKTYTIYKFSMIKTKDLNNPLIKAIL